MKRRIEAGDSFARLLLANENEEAEGLDALTEMINGNLCKLIPALPVSSCESIGNGALMKGIQNLNIYFLSTLKQLKEGYDNSHMTYADQKATCGTIGFTDLEISLTAYLYTVYEEIQDVFQGWTMNLIDSVEALLLKLFIFYIFVYTLLVGVAIYYLKEWVETERVEWRKMMRKIPFNIVSSNKLIRHYLTKEDRNI